MANIVQPTKWCLVKVAGSEVILLPTGISMVGRIPGSSIKLTSIYCSRRHCQFDVDATGAIKLVDFSTNGTFVNGTVYINVDVALSEGDRIGIGCEGDDDNVVEDDLPVYVLRLVPEKTCSLPEQVPPRPPAIHQVSKGGLSTDNDKEPAEQLQNVVKNKTVKNNITIIDLSDSDNDEPEVASDNCNLMQKRPEGGPVEELKESEPVVEQNVILKELTPPALVQLVDNKPKLPFLPNLFKPIEMPTSIDIHIKREILENVENATSVIDIYDSDDSEPEFIGVKNLPQRDSDDKSIIKVVEPKSIEPKSEEPGAPVLLHNAQFIPSRKPSQLIETIAATSLASSPILSSDKLLPGISNVTNTIDDEIFDISDDDEYENASKYLSQSFLHDIKQEYEGFDIEESLEIAPALDNQCGQNDVLRGDNEKNDRELIFSTNNSNENEIRVMSPLFLWLDMEDDSESESMENWIQKLSQSITTTIPADIKHPDETKSKSKNAILTGNSSEQKRKPPEPKQYDQNSTSRRSKTRTSSVERKGNQTDISKHKENQYTIRKASAAINSTKTDRKEKDSEQRAEIPSTSKHAGIRSSSTEASQKRTETKQLHGSASCSTRITRSTEKEKRKITRENSGDFQKSAPKRKAPEIIAAPSLPICRGKLRGVSAHVSAKVSAIKEETEKKLKTLRARDRLAASEKTLKEKWHQHPSILREEQKRNQQDLQNERKSRLREIAKAETEARKRKSQDDEIKVAKKPKVKITYQNRGAFLSTEQEIRKDPKVFLKRIPKLNNNKPVEDTIRHSISTDHRLRPIEKESSTRCANSLDSATGSVLNRIDVVDRPTISDRYKKSSNEIKKNTRRDSTFQENVTRPSVPNATPLARTSLNIKSILKPIGRIGKHNHDRSVKFSDSLNTVKYFDIDDGNVMMLKVNAKDAPMNLCSFINYQTSQNRKRQIQSTVDCSEIILTDILGWDPIWLETRKPEVNGANHTLLPMLHQFKNFEDFSKIVLPLLKIEIWHSIENDSKSREKIPFVTFKMVQLVVEKRANCIRYICHCEISSSTLQRKYFVQHELCIVKASNLQLFGSISACRNLNVSHSAVMQLSIELNGNPKHYKLLQSVSSIKIKPISNLRVEIGAFNAVNYLKYSPLGKCILNPFELIRNNDVKKTKVRYKGHDLLNENQETILIETYLKVIDTHRTNNISLIEGPPGTGKSRLITNLSMQILYGSEVLMLSKKILICAQSNAAIDVIALKLIELRQKMDCNKFNLIRFGVLESIHPNVQCVSTQKLIASNHRARQTDSDRVLLKDEIKIFDAQIAALSIVAGPDNVLYSDIQKLKQRRQRIDILLNNNPLTGQEEYPKYLCGAHIVCTTLSSCIKLLQYAKYFDICIIDEATQCLEPWSLIPLQFGISSLVLVGDTQQLPATCFSPLTNECGFDVSLFARIQKCLQGSGNNLIQMLRTQYRMHPEICHWPNRYFYKNMLKSDKSTSQLPCLIKPYSVLNLEYGQQQNNSKNGNISNELEAQFVIQLILNVSNFIPINYFTYAVITPYTQQRDYLQAKINEAGIKNVFVNTVDSYQGKEKDVIIISNARTRGVGFLGNCQRLNVALTRAKKCLIVCGTFSCLTREPVWKSLLDNARQRGLFYHVKKKDVQEFDKNVMCHLKVQV